MRFCSSAAFVEPDLNEREGMGEKMEEKKFAHLREEAKKMLPLGSVVLLKGQVKKYMICGRKQKDEKGDIYDYYGCEFPEGMDLEEDGILFDAGHVAMVLFLGYQDMSEIHQRFVLMQDLMDQVDQMKDGEE